MVLMPGLRLSRYSFEPIQCCPKLGSDMRRREFISLLGGAAAAWPVTARAQQARNPVVGVLRFNPENAAEPFVAPFRQAMRELGWDEGRTIQYRVVWAGGRNDLVPTLAAQLVRRRSTPSLVSAIPLSKPCNGRARRFRSSGSATISSTAVLLPAGATWRQYHRRQHSRGRSCRQATRIAARICVFRERMAMLHRRRAEVPRSDNDPQSSPRGDRRQNARHRCCLLRRHERGRNQPARLLLVCSPASALTWTGTGRFPRLVAPRSGRPSVAGRSTPTTR